MSNEVIIPITQALNDGILRRRELKQLMRRSNRPAAMHLLGWGLLLLTTGSLVALAIDSVWVWPAMFIHGIVLVHHFALQHECCHYTAFKTRWLNDLVGNLCGLVIMLPNQHFRYEHCDHHTYTQIRGKDPELIPLPASLWGYLWYISSIPYWRSKFTEIAMHIAGHVSANERRFVPADAHRAIFLEARLMAVFYVVVLLSCYAFNGWALLWFWWVPVLLGEPVMRAIRMTEHVGRPTTSNMQENTRSNRVLWPMRFLCWNMNYHAEHHYASSVPFFALPELHEKLNGHVSFEPHGYWGAHRDILGQLTGRRRRSDALPPAQV